MSVFEQMSDPKTWEEYYRYKEKSAEPKALLKELRKYIDSRSYLEVLERIGKGEDFPHARRIVISKMSTSKKRIVYTFPDSENYVLKLMTWLVIRKYDSLLAPCLYSFRPAHGVKQAIRYYTRQPGIGEMHSYKADISNYFNSVCVDDFLPMLREVMQDEPECLELFTKLLEDPFVWDGRELITETKGLMAGTPQASFFANLYLRDLDAYFYENHILYGRYSDDMILFAKTEEELESHRDFLKQELEKRGLKINPKKEEFTKPHEPWIFLGFSCGEGVIDICPASFEKLKGKIRRKRRTMERRKRKRKLSNERAAADFLRLMNRKLFENDQAHELTWARWFCPLITTTRSLEEIDHYLAENARILAAGTKTKARYNIRYEDLKRLGYRTLVNEYYRDWDE